MKYSNPSEFFKFIIEKVGIEAINDSQKCLSVALDLLDSEKPYFKLLKLAFNNNIYKELIKGCKADSNVKTHCINKAIKMLNEDCFIEKDKTIWAVGWLASVIYPNEWKSFSDKANIKEKDEDEIIWEQPKPTTPNSLNKESSIQETSPIIINVDNFNINNQENNLYKKNWILDDIGLEMVYCPAGCFMMGSPSLELGRGGEETQHQVRISKPFYIGKYEVTQKEYETVMRKNPSCFKGDNRPVERISWNEAMEFCDKLNNNYLKELPQGYKFDLPTEAQWEYACRAGTTTSLNNGENITTEIDYCYNLDELAWYDENSGGKTHIVGQKKPNAWGIYDMHGNVWEWCKDWYGSYPTDLVTDPIGPISGSYRVYRGGSWSLNASKCRSAYRNRNYPGNRDIILGFRLALVPLSSY